MQTITEEYLTSLTRKNVLALDVATHCGYYSVYGYGTQVFPNNDKAPKKLGPDYGQHKSFRQWLINKITNENVRLIAAEDVIYGHFIDFRKLCMLRGILFEVSETMDIPLITFKPSDIKKWTTGNGNADKKKVMEAVCRRFKIDVEGDDNAGDAAAIFFYVCRRYNL